MKPKYAIAFGLLVVGLSGAFALYQQQFDRELVVVVAWTTVVVAVIIASGKCRKGRRCRGRHRKPNCADGQHAMWM